MVTKQNVQIEDLKQAMAHSFAQQLVSAHEMKKDVREELLAKEDALLAANYARDELSSVLKKSAKKINKLEREVLHLGNDKIESDERAVVEKVALDQIQRDTAKQRRQLEVEQSELLLHQAKAESELASLEAQRSTNRIRRKDMQISHGKALEKAHTTSARHREVCFDLSHAMYRLFCFDLFLVKLDSLLSLLF
jgi:hypothetical protein